MSTVNIFGVIGEEFTAKDMVRFLEFNKEPVIDVNIASGGGSVFEGLMIYDLLVQSNRQINTNIVGLAGSAAGLIFMAGDERKMTVGGMLMTHKSSVMVDGNADDLQNKLETLRSIDKQMAAIIKSKTDMEDEAIEKLFNGDTFMGVDQAMTLGLATGISETESIAACIELYNREKEIKEPVKMATDEETKEAGFLAHMMAYFKKDEPQAKAEEEEVEEEAKAEGDEEKPEEEAKAEDKPEKEEEAKAEDSEDEDKEEMKAKIASLEAKLAAAEAKAESKDAIKAEQIRVLSIFDALENDKILMSQVDDYLAKPAEEVIAALKDVPKNATGRGKTEEPKEEPKFSAYEEYQSLTGDAKTAFFAKNKEEIINQMNTEK